MPRNILRELNLSAGRRSSQSESSSRWMTGVEAIVAINIDPENQHRIKVVIPMIDENLIFDKWVRPMGVDVGEPGFGSFFVPALKSEVILCGRLGQKHNLFYESSYNEDFEVAPDFRNEDGASGGGTVCGVRSPGDMKLIAEHDMQLRMGRAHIEADATIRLLAPGGVFINDRRIG